MFYWAIAWLVAFLTVIATLPLFIRNEVIVPVATSFLTVEGILVGLSGQVKSRLLRNIASVGLGIPVLLVSLITVTLASFQSTQLQYLSTDTVSILFRVNAFLLAFLVEIFAAGILLGKDEKTA